MLLDLTVYIIALAAIITGIDFANDFVNMNTKRKDPEDIEKCLEDKDFWDLYNDGYEVWK